MTSRRTSMLTGTDLRARMVQGAGAIFIMGVVNLVVLHDPALDMRGKIALLGTCIVSGAIAGALYFGTESLRMRGGWRAAVANVSLGLAYCVVAVGLLALAAWAGLLGE